MLKNQFEEWLLGMKACPQRVAYARSSNVARIEREKGLDLDEVFIDASVWGDLLAQFDYPMASWKKRIRPAHGIVFGDKANWYNGTNTLRHALRLYGEFKRWSEGGDGATERPAALPAAPSACSPTAEVPAKPSRAERKKSGGQNKDEMEDSYELFCEDFNIEPYQLYEFGLKRSHFAPLEKVVDQWKSLKKALLTGSTPLAIRKFGRQVDNPFHGLYHHLFPKALILNDANGNNAPKKAIQDATGWKINKNIRNYEISHVFSATNNPLLFNALWNFFSVPETHRSVYGAYLQRSLAGGVSTSVESSRICDVF